MNEPAMNRQLPEDAMHPRPRRIILPLLVFAAGAVLPNLACAHGKAEAVAIAKPCAEQVTPALEQQARDAVFNKDLAAAEAGLESLLKQVGVCVARAVVSKVDDELAALAANRSTADQVAASMPISAALALSRCQKWLDSHPPTATRIERRGQGQRDRTAPAPLPARYQQPPADDPRPIVCAAPPSTRALPDDLQDAIRGRPLPFMPRRPRRHVS